MAEKQTKDMVKVQLTDQNGTPIEWGEPLQIEAKIFEFYKDLAETGGITLGEIISPLMELTFCMIHREALEKKRKEIDDDLERLQNQRSPLDLQIRELSDKEVELWTSMFGFKKCDRDDNRGKC